MPYLSHITGQFVADDEAFAERAAFRTLSWKGTSWIAPDFGSNAVPFLLGGEVTPAQLQAGLNLVEVELAKDAGLYRVTASTLFATAAEVALGRLTLETAEEAV